MRDKPGDLQRSLHIKDAINEIQNFTGNVSFYAFMSNSMMQHACVNQIGIIGEASRHISNEIKFNKNNIDWKRIIGMRHILVHEYYGIVINLVWQVMKHELPILRPQIQQIIDNLPLSTV